MKKLLPLILLLMLNVPGPLSSRAQEVRADASTENVVDRAHAQDWSRDINAEWHTHVGDDPGWAARSFDDSKWDTVQLDDLGAARPGWRWFRIHLILHVNHPDLAMLIQGGEGTYALYINGVPVDGPELRSSFAVKRPTERVVAIVGAETDLSIALRTFTPGDYAAWHLPLFMNAVLGTPAAIESQRTAAQSDRLYSVLASIAINILLMLAGIGVFALQRSQPSHTEYPWVGAYLFLVGASNLFLSCQQSGLWPLAANRLVGDPLFYFCVIAQIEFTFRFGGHRVGRGWRIYEALLLAPLLLVWPCWFGWFPSETYFLIEAIVIVPAALLLPILLFIWYRRGNREAGWLILPSLLPAATVSLYDLGTASILFGWRRANFLDDPLVFGPISIQVLDLGDLLFLLGIGVVIFFRFNRVSREQARSAAELAAAREIQQRLVPASLPAIAGYCIEAAYVPAQEVGGDFYQVLEQADDSTLIVVGDVSGKGLRAAMTGALAIGALRAFSTENLGPAGLLARLNRQIFNAKDGGFITCMCARVEFDGSVRLANAGHLSPYCGGLEISVAPGLPLGLIGEVEYPETSYHLMPGAMLTLISDGVVEAMNSNGQLFGFERTLEISSQSAQDIATAAVAFGQEDDITVLTVVRVPA